MMKKVLFILLLPVFLTGCEVHFGGASYNVPWWVIALPTAAILLAAFIYQGQTISKFWFSCPSCHKRFRPNWLMSAFSIHINDAHIFRCPHCGTRGICDISYNQSETE